MFFQKIFRFLLVAIFMTLLFIGCNTHKEEKLVGMLPSSKGDVGELILVADSAYWNGTLGDTLKGIFKEPVPGILQGEPMFTVRYVRPYQFKGLLREHRNLVLVTTFDKATGGNSIMQKFFTPETIEKIKQDPSYFFIPQTDEFASDQVVLQLFAATQELLLQKLSDPKVKRKIQDVLNQKEEERVKKRMYSERGTVNAEMMELLKEKYGFELKVPQGYRLAKDSTHVLWLRMPEANFDKNLIISFKPYTSEEQFSDQAFLAWRNEIGHRHLADPEFPDRYIVTEALQPVSIEETQLSGKFAKSMRGLWRINGRFTGGSFVSFMVTSADNQRIYYIEGLVTAPGTKKRELLRELTSIISTFKG